jgi:predicted nuclease with TOPRIM domain
MNGGTEMSDGGKGSAPRPYSVGIDEFNDNFERIFGVKTRVSGVPYEVELPDEIATLEQENRQMRARMDRLEDENRRLEEEIVQLRIRLHNSETTQGQH